jgi:hypothetical protein
MKAPVVSLAILAAILSPHAHAQGSYPEPPPATRTLAITDQTIAQAQTTSNPLSDFLASGRLSRMKSVNSSFWRRTPLDTARSANFTASKIKLATSNRMRRRR